MTSRSTTSEPTQAPRPQHDPGDHDDSDLRRRLRGLAAINAADGGFRAALHRRLAAEPAPPPMHLPDRLRGWLRAQRAWLWPMSGVATGVATFLLLLAIRGTPVPAAPEPAPSASPLGVNAASQSADTSGGAVLPSFRVPASKVAVVKLAFAAEVAVEDVTFEVTLPEGLAFWSQGKPLDERTFRWPGRLQAGENAIPIAVRTDRPGRYPVVATVSVGGRVLEHRVVLDVRREGT